MKRLNISFVPFLLLAVAGLFCGLGSAWAQQGSTAVGAGFSADKFYAFHRMKNTSAYAVETASGKLSTSSSDNTKMMYWKFIPSGKTDCYYIQNAVSKRFIQSTNRAKSSQIPMGDTRVEFKIAKDNTAGATTSGFYYLCSTDQSNIPTGALGLNYDGNNTKNIVAWGAKSGNQNSYWQIVELPFDYEVSLLPLVADMTMVTDAACYTLNAGGKQLAVKQGDLVLDAVAAETKNAWVFVGTSNSREGIFLVNMSQPTKVLTVDAAGTYSFAEPTNGTRWYVTEKNVQGMNQLAFVPFVQKDNPNAPFLSVGTDDCFTLGNFRSAFSLASQIYSLPCGALDQAYISKLTISGEHVQKKLNFAVNAKPNHYYTLYTKEKATVSAGQTFDLKISLQGVDAATKTFVYFDWNRDGLFETMKSFTGNQINDAVSVPADAVTGKARMRIRVTNNALTDAEDDVVGSLYDFIIYMATPQTKRHIAVRSNDVARGKAEILVGHERLSNYDGSYGEEVSVMATPNDKLSFLAWKDDRTIVSTEQTYTFAIQEHATLTACFSPNSTISTDLQSEQVEHNNFVYDICQDAQTVHIVTDAKVKMVYVFATDGTLVRKGASKKVSVAGLPQGSYIIKVVTRAGDGSKKIAIK